MTGITLDSVLQVPDTTAARELDNEIVLLNLESGIYFGLDAVGARVWQLLGAGGSLREVHRVLREEYEVDDEALGADLIRLARELAEHRLVVIRPEGASP